MSTPFPVFHNAKISRFLRPQKGFSLHREGKIPITVPTTNEDKGHQPYKAPEAVNLHYS